MTKRNILPELEIDFDTEALDDCIQLAGKLSFKIYELIE